jgi:hypothetical protein
MHAWDPISAAEADFVMPQSPLWFGARYVYHLRCLRCKSVKDVAIDHRGNFLARRYRYVDDYARPAGEGRADSAKLRLWLAKG